MSLAVVQAIEQDDFSGTTDASISKAFASNVTAGNMLLCFFAGDRASSPTDGVTDSLGQMWTAIGTPTHFGGAYGQWFYMANTLGGACTVTATLGSGGETFVFFVILEVSGADASSPIDASDLLKTGTSTSGNPTSNSITTDAANCLIISLCTSDAGSWTFTKPTGWTALSTVTAVAYETLVSAGSVSATWTKSGSGSIAYWVPIVAIKPSTAPSNTVAPAVTGTATVGDTLTTGNGTWSGSPTGYTYQWQRDNAGGGSFSNITGATASTYALADADVGNKVRCVVTATNGAGSTAANSNATARTSAVAASCSSASVAGSARVGSTLMASATTGGDPAPAVTYQWQTDASGSFVNIGGATGSTYVPVTGDIGNHLRVIVTADNSSSFSGGSASSTSSETAAVVEEAAAVLPDYRLEIAFNEIVDGLFTVDGSALDGTDGLSDRLLFSGTFDDASDDVVNEISVVIGTDQLAGAVQAANLTVSMLDPHDLSKWNPNNPDSPLNGDAPGFTPMRPVRLTATVDGVDIPIFTGWISRADWSSEDCSCELYCEDLLMRAARVFPVIESTGPTTTGAVMELLFAAVGNLEVTDFDDGDDLDDFSADGTIDVVTIIGNLLAAERGTVFIAGDGTPVFESRSRVRCRDATATLSDDLTGLQGGIDIQSIFTRATVTSTVGDESVSWISSDADAERRFGRADLPEISSDYIPDGAGQTLADDLVFESRNGKPPITITLDSESSDNVALMVNARLLNVYTIDETLGDTDGDYAAQRIEHTITSTLHQASILATARATREMTVDGSAIDGPHVLRY